MKLLSGLLLATALALASCEGGVRPIVQASPQGASMEQEVELVQDLGDGYQTKVRGDVRLIKFPADRYLTAEEGSGDRFREAMKIALVKVFTSAAFDGGKPKIELLADGTIAFKAGDYSYEIGPLFLDNAPESPIVGISIRRLPRA